MNTKKVTLSFLRNNKSHSTARLGKSLELAHAVKSKKINIGKPVRSIRANN